MTRKVMTGRLRRCRAVASRPMCDPQGVQAQESHPSNATTSAPTISRKISRMKNATARCHQLRFSEGPPDDGLGCLQRAEADHKSVG